MFLREMMFINQVNQNQKSMIFVTIKGSKFHPDVCNGCHDLLMMSMNLGSIVILNIKGADYCCVSGIRIKEAISLM